MKFADFSFKNFKGINKMKLELTESPDSKIYALVGLNESGKTTILEAISTYKSEEMPMTKETRNSKTNPNDYFIVKICSLTQRSFIYVVYSIL